MNAHILSIGDELLIGQIVNTNTVWIAQQLNLRGIAVEGMTTLSDSPESIIEGLERALQRAQLVIITGGLGPTKDDLTKELLAQYFNMPLAFHEPSFANIERLLNAFNRQADERYRKQAFMPVGATILINSMGTASGMCFEAPNDKLVFSLPGVPREMRCLMEEAILPLVQTRYTLPTILHKTLLTTGKGETDLSELLEDFELALPPFIKLAYLPDTMRGRVRLRLSAKGSEREALEMALEQYSQKLSDILDPKLCYGQEEETMQEVLGKLLLAKNMRIGTAESCTGGLISHLLTTVPGSSAYMQGAVVSYSNQVKQDILGVPEDILETEGAVSEATVHAMLKGLFKSLPIDCGIAISGIAGPGGARPNKPVGTVWLAYGRAGDMRTKLLQLGGDRERITSLAAHYALNLLRLYLLEEEQA